MRPVIVRRAESAADVERFVRLPFALYRDDRNWVAPLLTDARNTLTPGRNPFWGHADRETWLAERDGVVVGRIAAICDRNYNDFHKTAIAFWGFFESDDDPDVAGALFDAAAAFARRHGCTALYGPANPSMNDESGLLIDPFDSPPMLKMSYNPPFYARLVEGCGFAKVKDLYAYIIDLATPVPEKMQRVMSKLRQKRGLVVRPVSLERLHQELRAVKEIYNDAWSQNWDFAPMTEDEIGELARQLKPLLKPELCPLVLYNDEPAGMCIALPDYNVILRRLNGRLLPFGWLKFIALKNSISQARLWALGLKRKFHNLGFDSLLYYECLLGTQRLGYKRIEVSWILEDNIHIIRPIQMWGGRLYKTYRIYQRPVA